MSRRLILSACVLLACGGDGPAGAPDAGGAGADVPYVKDTAVPLQDVPLLDNHPPVLERIGDRIVQKGLKLEIRLNATDQDGDELTFHVYGDIPGGAQFDKAAHVFTWIPMEPGLVVFLTFVVSDGTDMDRETVRIEVVEQAEGVPPYFVPVSDQHVEAGKPFTLQLEAHDPNGDDLEFAVVGEGPPGAHLDPVKGLFEWTPPMEVDGTVVKVVFAVSDGVYKDIMEVRFLVGDVTEGAPPEFGKMEDRKAEVGHEIRFGVEVTDPDGDEVTVSMIEGPAAASFDGGTFAWTPSQADAGHSVDVEFSATDGRFTVYAGLRIDVGVNTGPQACSDDPFEPNNDASQATELAPGDYPDLSICDTDLSPVDSDWFRLALETGDNLYAVVEFEHDLGDIDAALVFGGEVVQVSDGLSDVEELHYLAQQGGQYLLVVYGAVNMSYANPYSLSLSIQDAPKECEDDDLEPDDDPAHANPVLDDWSEFPSMVLCPGDDDYFVVSLEAGDGFLAAATPKGGTLGMELLGPGGTVLDFVPEGSEPVTVGLEDAGAGDHLVRVFSGQGTPYVFETLVEHGPADGCDPLSCPDGYVCDQGTGQCVTGTCTPSQTCPAGYDCIQDHCVNPCKNHDDCRPGHLCKSMLEGWYCGTEGGGASGAQCASFAQCAGERTCLFLEHGGYCAVGGCETDWECPLDSWCVMLDGVGPVCAAECADGACPGSGGDFGCVHMTSRNGFGVDLCVPAW